VGLAEEGAPPVGLAEEGAPPVALAEAGAPAAAGKGRQSQSARLPHVLGIFVSRFRWC